MKKIVLNSVPVETECNYPTPFDEPCSLQSCRAWRDMEVSSYSA
jgi:hypothetical protein